MRPGAVSPQMTVEARAERFQRRITGPWKTVEDHFGPVVLTRRYRWRPPIESCRLAVALRDCERAFWAPLVPPLQLIIGWVARLLANLDPA